MKWHKQFALTLLVLASFVFGLAGCEAKTIEKAKSSSSKLATYANAGVNVTRDLYRENVLSLETKDKIADAFIILADAGIAFDTAVAKAEAAYGSDVPRSEIDKLFAVFDGEVVGKFLAVLQTLKLIRDTGPYAAIIEALKTSVLLIAKAFNRVGVVEGRLAQWTT